MQITKVNVGASEMLEMIKDLKLFAFDLFFSKKICSKWSFSVIVIREQRENSIVIQLQWDIGHWQSLNQIFLWFCRRFILLYRVTKKIGATGLKVEMDSHFNWKKEQKA